MTKVLNIVVFSGAGMSAESGIQTFRDSNGLWENYAIEDVATPNAWHKNPDLVTEFYNQRRKKIMEAEPNEAHHLISELGTLGNLWTITQNIDDLHERSNCQKVLHLHGNIRYAKSSGPNQDKLYLIDGWKINASDVCSLGFRLRPHVVWFGEEVPNYPKAIELIKSADVFLVVGTSLQVYPVANLIHFANNAALKIIVDPKIDQMKVPSNFICIQDIASNGIKKAKEIIEEWISEIR